MRLVLARLEARLLGGGGGLCLLGEAGALLGLELGDGAWKYESNMIYFIHGE